MAERKDRLEFYLCVSCVVSDQSQYSIFHVIMIMALRELTVCAPGDHIVNMDDEKLIEAIHSFPSLAGV